MMMMLGGGYSPDQSGNALSSAGEYITSGLEENRREEQRGRSKRALFRRGLDQKTLPSRKES